MQFSARYKGKNGWTIHILPYLFIMHSRIREREDIVIQLLFINRVISLFSITNLILLFLRCFLRRGHFSYFFAWFQLDRAPSHTHVTSKVTTRRLNHTRCRICRGCIRANNVQCMIKRREELKDIVPVCAGRYEVVWIFV